MTTTNDQVTVGEAGLGLGVLFAMLSLSFFYPQEAFGLRALIVVAGLCLLLPFALIGLFPLLKQSNPAKFTAIAAALWCSWWLVRLLQAPVPTLGYDTVTDILQGGLVFFIAWSAAANWSTEPCAQKYSIAQVTSVWIAALATFIALHGLYQSLGPAWLPGTHASLALEIEKSTDFNPAMRDAMLHLLREGRASGRFGSANIFAGMLAITLPILLALAFHLKKIFAKVLLFLGAAAVFAAILAAGSRGGLLSALFGMFVLTLLTIRRPAKAIPAATIILLLLALPLAAQDDFARRWLGGTTVMQRIYYWQSGFAIWSDNWLFGRGPGAFQLFYFMHRIPGAQETAYAHNWFVQWGSETGAIGIAIFIAWVGSIAAGVLRWWRDQDSSTRLLTAGLRAAAAVAVCGGLVEFTLSFREVYLLFTFILGILAGTSKVARASRPCSHIIAAVVPVILILAAFWHVQIKPAVGEYYSERALETNDPTGAIALFTRAIDWQPSDPRYWESRGFARLNAVDTRAYDDFKRALELNPHSPRLHQSMAKYLAAAGRLPEAIEWQRKAVALHPLDAMHRLVLAEMLWQAGERDEPRQLVEEASELIPNNEEILFANQLRQTFGMAE